MASKRYDFYCLGCGATVQALYPKNKRVHRCEICGTFTDLSAISAPPLELPHAENVATPD